MKSCKTDGCMRKPPANLDRCKVHTTDPLAELLVHETELLDFLQE